MIQSVISTVTLVSFLSLSTLGSTQAYIEPVKLAEHTMSLDNRQPDKFVNGVFKDNILLTLAYLRGIESKDPSVNWDEVRKPFSYEFSLNPDESFSYHDGVFAEYKGKINKTTSAHFNGLEGFKSDGYLMGDGVCHLASLIYWAAKDAGLNTKAPVNHDFAAINEVPKEFGVSIYADPNSSSVSEQQNLYITNNFDKAVTFKFEFDGNHLKVNVLKNS